MKSIRIRVGTFAAALFLCVAGTTCADSIPWYYSPPAIESGYSPPSIPGISQAVYAQATFADSGTVTVGSNTYNQVQLTLQNLLPSDSGGVSYLTNLWGFTVAPSMTSSLTSNLVLNQVSGVSMTPTVNAQNVPLDMAGKFDFKLQTSTTTMKGGSTVVFDIYDKAVPNLNASDFFLGISGGTSTDGPQATIVDVQQLTNGTSTYVNYLAGSQTYPQVPEPGNGVAMVGLALIGVPAAWRLRRRKVA
jgi:hypothetical protein